MKNCVDGCVWFSENDFCKFKLQKIKNRGRYCKHFTDKDSRIVTIGSILACFLFLLLVISTICVFVL